MTRLTAVGGGGIMIVSEKLNRNLAVKYVSYGYKDDE